MRYAESVKADARARHANGESYADIGRALGIYATTIACWLNPARAQAHRDKAKFCGKAKRDKDRETRDRIESSRPVYDLAGVDLRVYPKRRGA